jgi:TolA-binding protein
MKHLVPAILLAVLLSACATSQDFEALKGRVDVLEKEKSAIQEDQKRDLEKMERLHADLIEATEALRKNGANLGADIDAAKTDITKLQGVQEETAYGLQKLADDVDRIRKALDEKGISVLALPKGAPEDANSLFGAGKAAWQKADNTTARGVLGKFLDTFPDDARAAEAQYLVGDTYFKDGKYGQAIRELQKVFDRYKDVKGSPATKALYRIGEALLKQNDCRKAAGVFKFLLETDRKAPEAGHAKDQLKALKKSCKGL